MNLIDKMNQKTAQTNRRNLNDREVCLLQSVAVKFWGAETAIVIEAVRAFSANIGMSLDTAYDVARIPVSKRQY